MTDHLGYTSSLSFNPDGTRFASVDSLGAIKIWHGLPNEKSDSQGMRIPSDKYFLSLGPLK